MEVSLVARRDRVSHQSDRLPHSSIIVSTAGRAHSAPSLDAGQPTPPIIRLSAHRRKERLLDCRAHGPARARANGDAVHGPYRCHLDSRAREERLVRRVQRPVRASWRRSNRRMAATKVSTTDGSAVISSRSRNAKSRAQMLAQRTKRHAHVVERPRYFVHMRMTAHASSRYSPGMRDTPR